MHATDALSQPIRRVHPARADRSRFRLLRGSRMTARSRASRPPWAPPSPRIPIRGRGPAPLRRGRLNGGENPGIGDSALSAQGRARRWSHSLRARTLVRGSSGDFIEHSGIDAETTAMGIAELGMCAATRFSVEFPGSTPARVFHSAERGRLAAREGLSRSEGRRSKASVLRAIAGSDRDRRPGWLRRVIHGRGRSSIRESGPVFASRRILRCALAQRRRSRLRCRNDPSRSNPFGSR